MNSLILTKQVLDVIKWNAVARNGVHLFDEDTIQKQISYVISEAKETILGLCNKDRKEVLDGVADVFVTLSYLEFLKTQKVPEIPKPEDISGKTDLDLLAIVALIPTSVTSDIVDVGDVWGLFCDCVIPITERAYGVDIHAVINAVLESNWTKYPKLKDVPDLEEECRWIEANRDQKNINFAVVEVDNEQYVVFRNNSGTGKIMKPRHFKEPAL